MSRPLTHLYNASPAWLNHAHKALDEAVDAAQFTAMLKRKKSHVAQPFGVFKWARSIRPPN